MAIDITQPEGKKVSDELISPVREQTAVRKVAGNWLARGSVPIAWAVIVIIFSALRPATFPTIGTFGAIFGSQAVLVIVTLGLLVPLRAGDYDLSVAGTLTLSSMIIGRLNGGAGVEIWICVVIALAIGVAVGLANGFFVRVFGINPFIVTLGMGTLLLGITLLISNDQTYSGVSQGLDNITEVDRFLGIPLEFYYALGLCVVVWYVFEHTSLGRRLLFVGSGREVARLSGVREPDGREHLLAPRVRGGVSRRHHDRAGTVQRLGHHRGGILPRHRGYRTRYLGSAELGADSLLWWRADPGSRVRPAVQGQEEPGDHLAVRESFSCVCARMCGSRNAAGAARVVMVNSVPGRSGVEGGFHV